MKKALSFALLLSFVLTLLVPLTGIRIHKLASALFLLLTLLHTVLCRRGLRRKRYLLLALVLLSFFSGLFGMIWEQYPLILILHRVSSIAVVFFAAIHIFVFHRRLFQKKARRE